MRESRKSDVTVILHCTECGRGWEDPTERWRMYVTSDDPPESGVFCPRCAGEEFDG
jgi:hypothetical protein